MSLILIPVDAQVVGMQRHALDAALEAMRRQAPEHTFVAVPGMTALATIIPTDNAPGPAVPPPVDAVPPNDPPTPGNGGRGVSGGGDGGAGGAVRVEAIGGAAGGAGGAGSVSVGGGGATNLRLAPYFPQKQRAAAAEIVIMRIGDGTVKLPEEMRSYILNAASAMLHGKPVTDFATEAFVIKQGEILMSCR